MKLVCITCGATVAEWPANDYGSHQAAKWINDAGKLFVKHKRDQAKAPTVA